MCIETFSSQIFPLLFRAHPYLERVKFNPFRTFSVMEVIDFADNAYGRETFDWCLLKRIKVLSLHPSIIHELDHQHGPAFFKFLTVCPSLEELDIYQDSVGWIEYVFNSD